MFNGYLQQPLSFHIEKNSATLIRNTVNEVAMFVGALNAATSFVSEIIVLAGIILLLLILVMIMRMMEQVTKGVPYLA